MLLSSLQFLCFLDKLFLLCFFTLCVLRCLSLANNFTPHILHSITITQIFPFYHICRSELSLFDLGTTKYKVKCLIKKKFSQGRGSAQGPACLLSVQGDLLECGFQGPIYVTGTMFDENRTSSVP